MSPIFNFLGSSSSDRDNVQARIQFRRESQPQNLKDDFSSKTVPSIFTSIAPLQHNVRQVFPSTHNSASIPRHVSYLENNNNNITNYHLPLKNLFSSSQTESSPSSLSLNLSLSEHTFSLLKISCSWIYHCVCSSVKFSLFFMMLFNTMLLHQPLQNVFIFNSLTDFTLLF